MTATLAVVGLYDELASGVVVVAAPGVEDAQSLGHDEYAFWVFALPLLLSALIEAPVAMLSDRMRRQRVLRWGLVGLAVSLALCALADRPWLLAAGLALAGAASGVACASAQGELVSAYAGNAERAMARWTTFAAAGDVLAPLLVGVVLWQGGSYRAGLLLVAALLVVQLVFTRRAEPAACSAPDEDSEPREPLRAALARPRLWLLLLGAEFCALLDEVVVALAALRMTRDLGASQALTAAALTAFSLGSLLGAALMDALLARLSGRRLLLGSACASLAALGLVVSATSPLGALAALLVLGASAAPHFALLQAAAYEAVPGRPGLVNAASQLLVGVEVVLPLCVGVLAARYGLGFALGALAVQPLFVLAAALFLLRRRD